MLLIAAEPTTVTQSGTSLILIAVIAGLGAILAGSIPIYVNGRQTRKARAEDWARQDAVAERAVEAVAAAEAVAKHAADTAAEAAKAAAGLDEKLTRIAHQTDGLYTTALESELRALIGQAATLREVVALRAATDSQVDNSRTLGVIEASEKRISELEEGLRRRAEYQDSLEHSRPAGTPREVVIVNPELLGVSVKEVAIKAEDLTGENAVEVTVVNPDPIPVRDTPANEGGS